MQVDPGKLDIDCGRCLWVCKSDSAAYYKLGPDIFYYFISLSEPITLLWTSPAATQMQKAIWLRPPLFSRWRRNCCCKKEGWVATRRYWRWGNSGMQTLSGLSWHLERLLIFFWLELTTTSQSMKTSSRRRQIFCNSRVRYSVTILMCTYSISDVVIKLEVDSIYGQY